MNLDELIQKLEEIRRVHGGEMLACRGSDEYEDPLDLRDVEVDGSMVILR